MLHIIRPVCLRLFGVISAKWHCHYFTVLQLLLFFLCKSQTWFAEFLWHFCWNADNNGLSVPGVSWKNLSFFIFALYMSADRLPTSHAFSRSGNITALLAEVDLQPAESWLVLSVSVSCPSFLRALGWTSGDRDLTAVITASPHLS